ncbi:MAG: hypothetical protein KF784_14875 [Fimbriimonadaceae bacterium]|nr:hypothetical protein [Fimbriimonadaceae bacterium]
MRSFFILFAALLSLLVVAQAKQVQASDLIGKWDGKFEIDFNKVSSTRMPQEIAQMKEIVKTRRYSFEFRKDKTYESVVTAGAKVGNKTKGTWALDGKKLTLVDTEVLGKPIPKEKRKDQEMIVVQTGKTVKLQVASNFAPTFIVLTKPKK